MPHSIDLITLIAVGLGLALVLGFLAIKLRLPALVGYLLAGIVIGPATPGLVADIDLARQLAEIGVILLMFGVGLHFSLADLLSVRRIALPGAVAQILVATALGLGIAMYWWDWSFGAGLVFGLSLSCASTVVLLRALEDRNLLGSLNGRIAVGWLVVEDLAMVLVLVLLPPFAAWTGAQSAGGAAEAGAAGMGSLALALLWTIGKVALFAALMFLVGRKVFPALLLHVSRSGSRELFTLSVVAVALGVAYGAAGLFGVSFALGAFFAGMVMRESDLSARAAHESLPLRDAFAVLFFVAVGMLFDPMVLVEEPLKVLAVLAVILVGKSLAAFVIVLLFRYPLNTALTVSASLAQIGEFSFILAALGLSLGLLSSEAQSLVLAGALLSIAVNPLVFHGIEPIQAWIRRRSRLARFFERTTDPLAELPMSTDLRHLAGHVVLVGYGRVGRRIGEALAAQGISCVVAEQNREIVQQLRARGLPAVSGEAAEPAVLIQAHVTRAAMLVIAIPDAAKAVRMMEIARTLNPGIETVVRSHTEDEGELLARERADRVFLGEHELATSMARHALARMAERTAAPAAD